MVTGARRGSLSFFMQGRKCTQSICNESYKISLAKLLGICQTVCTRYFETRKNTRMEGYRIWGHTNDTQGI